MNPSIPRRRAKDAALRREAERYVSTAKDLLSGQITEDKIERCRHLLIKAFGLDPCAPSGQALLVAAVALRATHHHRYRLPSGALDPYLVFGLNPAVLTARDPAVIQSYYHQASDLSPPWPLLSRLLPCRPPRSRCVGRPVGCSPQSIPRLQIRKAAAAASAIGAANCTAWPRHLCCYDYSKWCGPWASRWLSATFVWLAMSGCEGACVHMPCIVMSWRGICCRSFFFVADFLFEPYLKHLNGVIAVDSIWVSFLCWVNSESTANHYWYVFLHFFYTMASSIASMTALAVDWKYATTNCLDWKYATANSYVKRTAVLLRWHGFKYIVVTYF